MNLNINIPVNTPCFNDRVLIMNNFFSFSFFVFIISLFLLSPAQAYLDGGTGSMIVQLLAGGVAGAAMVGKLYWHKIKTFFSKGSKDDSVSTSENEDTK